MKDEPIQVFQSVWDALEDSPDEAAGMRLRSELAIRIRNTVESWQTTATAAATRLGVTQPRLNDLLRGRLDRFDLDSLIALAERAGLTVRMDIVEVTG
jgi:predicted XRE-type DNA-binding protein